MFRVGAPAIKRFCKECGNVTALEVTRKVTKGVSFTQSIVCLGLSVLIIVLLELARLYVTQ